MQPQVLELHGVLLASTFVSCFVAGEISHSVQQSWKLLPNSFQATYILLFFQSCHMFYHSPSLHTGPSPPSMFIVLVQLLSKRTHSLLILNGINQTDISCGTTYSDFSGLLHSSFLCNSSLSLQ